MMYFLGKRLNLLKRNINIYMFFFAKITIIVAPGGIINEDFIDTISSFSKESHKIHIFLQNSRIVPPRRDNK